MLGLQGRKGESYMIATLFWLQEVPSVILISRKDVVSVIMQNQRGIITFKRYCEGNYSDFGVKF